MIVLGHEGHALQVPGTQSRESLTRLELQVDLVADEAVQSVDLRAIVGDEPNPTIHQPPRWQYLGASCSEGQNRQQGRRKRHRPSSVHHIYATHGAALSFAEPGSGNTSGSVPISSTLKPSGFQ